MLWWDSNTYNWESLKICLFCQLGKSTQKWHTHLRMCSKYNSPYLFQEHYRNVYEIYLDTMIYCSAAPLIQGLTIHYNNLQNPNNSLKRKEHFSDLGMSCWQLHWEHFTYPEDFIGLLSAFRAEPDTLSGHKGSCKCLEPFQKHWDNLQGFYSCRYKMLI